jgi:adenosylhomocysteine nucleosidase
MVIRTGVGMVKAEDACRTLLQDHQLDLIVSSGFACALSASAIGDLVIGTDVIRAENPDDLAEAGESISCISDVVDAAVIAARRAAVPARTGRVVSVPRILWRAEDKRRAAAKSGAIGLDMESAAVGMCAVERNVPFAVMRTVSDLLDEDLPMDFNLFRNPIDWPRGILACLTRPSSLLGLHRLRSQAATASDRLTLFFGRFFDDLDA